VLGLSSFLTMKIYVAKKVEKRYTIVTIRMGKMVMMATDSIYKGSKEGINVDTHGECLFVLQDGKDGGVWLRRNFFKSLIGALNARGAKVFRSILARLVRMLSPATLFLTNSMTIGISES
jgi:hypothetical protein